MWTCSIGVFVVVAWVGGEEGRGAGDYAVRLTVTSELVFPRVPMDPTIDFGSMIREAGIGGVLDPNSIAVVNSTTGRAVPHAIEGFQYGDRGRVEWVIADPAHKEYEIRFGTAAARRPARANGRYTPLIGVGDLLRYNAGQGRPFAITRSMAGLVDVNGDGSRDLVGTWSYAHRPGDPWNGIVFWPRVGGDDEFRFGDMVRFRELPAEYYTAMHVRDVDRDGLADLAYAKVFYGDGTSRASVFRNTGRRAAVSGIYLFEPALKLCSPSIQWHAIRVADLDRDGALDVVFVDNGRYTASSTNWFMRNENAAGWPFKLAEPVPIRIVGDHATFADVDGDGVLDAVSLMDKADPRGLSDYYVGWQKGDGRPAPGFGPARDLPEINARIVRPGDLVSVTQGPRRGLLVVYDDKQRTGFFEPEPGRKGPPYFSRFTEATCDSAVIALSDQAKPYVTDWDGDGDWDLLAGHGYGWIRIVINTGTSDRPVFAEARLVESEREPIRILRSEVLGTPGNGHNMGYTYPEYVDWDADGLPDLMVPNETNRLFWYKNVGTRADPIFSKQRQVVCDGYPDSPAKRDATRLLTIDPKLSCYPPDDNSPFPWRCGAGFADWNGDGFMDLVTTSGVAPKQATLFVQYRGADGSLRLRRDRTLKTTDGGTLQASRYACVDWDGDGDVDIVCGHSTSTVSDTFHLARNVGTGAEPVFEYEPLRFFGEQLYITRHGPKMSVADMDGDGRPDILASVEWSVYPFYCHAALMMKERPGFTLGEVRLRTTGRARQRKQLGQRVERR